MSCRKGEPGAVLCSAGPAVLVWLDAGHSHRDRSLTVSHRAIPPPLPCLHDHHQHGVLGDAADQNERCQQAVHCEKAQHSAPAEQAVLG